MADYRVVTAVKLAYEVGRVRGILIKHLKVGVSYTPEDILDVLKKYGLDYSNPEYVPIGSALIAEGTIEVAP